MPTRRIRAVRRVGRRVGPATLKSQIEHAIGTAMKSGRGRGWSYTIGKIHCDELPEERLYTVIISFRTTRNQDSLLDKFPAIVTRFAEAASSGNLRKTPWKVVEPEGYTEIAAEATEKQQRADRRKTQAQEPKELGEIIIDPGTHFNRLFGRDAQIRRVLAALQLAKATEYRKRPHMLFCGDPGGGKTEMTRCMQDMLGEENKAWLRYDAPAMTKAGALEDLMSSSKVPPILFLEEVEKVETDHALRWLLGLMDERGVIQRTNYRVGNQARNVRMVVVATCNDVRLLRRVMYGALYSRFKGNVINFPYPDHEIMRAILQRELADIAHSDPAWIDAAMSFGYDDLGIRDPREIISIMNVGGDELLSGVFQQDYLNTMHPDDLREIKENKRALEQREDEVKALRKPENQRVTEASLP